MRDRYQVRRHIPGMSRYVQLDSKAIAQLQCATSLKRKQQTDVPDSGQISSFQTLQPMIRTWTYLVPRSTRPCVPFAVSSPCKVFTPQHAHTQTYFIPVLVYVRMLVHHWHIIPGTRYSSSTGATSKVAVAYDTLVYTGIVRG